MPELQNTPTVEQTRPVAEASPDRPVYKRPERLRSIAEIYCELGFAYWELGDRLRESGDEARARRRYADAAQAFRAAIREAPEESTLHRYLAQVYEADGKKDLALGAYLQAIRVDPRCTSEVLPRAHDLLDAVQAASVEAWQAPFEDDRLDVESRAALHNFMGRSFLYRGDYDEAVAHYEQALGILEGDGAHDQQQVRSREGAAAPYEQAARSPEGDVAPYEPPVHSPEGDVAPYESPVHNREGDVAPYEPPVHSPESAGDLFILEGLGEALRRSRQLERAADILRRAVDEADRMPELHRRAATRLKLARVLVARRQYADAAVVIREGLALHEEADDPFRALLGRCYLEVGHFERALAATALVSIGADADTQVEADVVRAAAYFGLRSYEKAAEAAEEALRRSPQHLEAIRIRAQSLLLSEEPDREQAIRLLKVYTQKRRDPDVQRLLVRTLQKSGWPAEELAAALDALIAMTEAPQDRASLQVDLVEVLLQSPHRADLLVLLDQAAESLSVEQDPRWWRLRGDVQHRGGDAEAALASYRKAREMSPEDVTLLERIAALHDGRDEVNAAIEAYRTWVRHAPENGTAWLRLAELLARTEAYEEALSAAERASSAPVDDEAPAYELKGKILDVLGRPRSDVAAAYREAGLRRYGRGDHQDAERLLSRARELDPEDQSTCWYLADALLVRSFRPEPPYLDADRAGEGIEVWNSAAARAQPDRAHSWAYLTRAYLNEQLAKLPGTDDRSLLWEAIALLEGALLQNESFLYSWVAFARFHRMLDNESVVLHATGRAVEARPDDVFVLDERAAILANTGRFEEAIEAIDRRRQLAPNDWADAVKAYSLMGLNEYEPALDLVEGAVAADPNNIWYRELRAICFRKLGMKQEAEVEYGEIWRRYVPDDNADSGNRFTYGWAAFHLGKVDEALELFQKLLAEAQSSSDPTINLYDANRSVGHCHLRLYELELGEQHLGTAIQQMINVSQVDRVLEAFDELEEAAGGESRESDLGAVLDRLRRRARERRDELAELPTALEQMVRIHSMLEQSNATGHWAWIGASAGLARLYAEQERWYDAAALYRKLEAHSDRFPLASLGLENLIEKMQQRGERRLADGEFEEARNLFSQALDLLPSSEAYAPQHAGLHARLGYAGLKRSNEQGARDRFGESLRLYRAAGTEQPGQALGETLRGLLQTPADFWLVHDLLHVFATYDRSMSEDFRDARQVVSTYLENRYQLSRSAGAVMHPIVSPITLELGSALYPEGDVPPEEWLLLETHLPEMRARIKREMGIRVPRVNARAGERLEPAQYVVSINEIPRVLDHAELGKRFSPVEPEVLDLLQIRRHALTSGSDPVTSRSGFWIPEEHFTVIESTRLEWWDPIRFVARHLEAVLRSHLSAFLGVQEVEDLLAEWAQEDGGDALVRTALPDAAARSRFGRILRSLAEEQVSISRWRDILETVRRTGLTAFNAQDVVEELRLRLLAHQWSAFDGVPRIRIPSDIEEKLDPWIRREHGRTFLAMPPEEAQEILADLRELIGSEDARAALITGKQELRPYFRRLAESTFSQVTILSSAELRAVDDAKTSEIPDSVIAYA